MRKAHVCVCFTVILIWGTVILCAAIPNSTWTSTILNSQIEKNEDLKARITVGEFTDKTASGGEASHWDDMYGMQWPQIGEGMKEMLMTALFNANRFIVLERAQLDVVLNEQDLGEAGRIKKGTETPVGEILGADLLITAAVTEFEGSAKGIGGKTKVLGVEIKGGQKKAHIAIDIRVIDMKTSQIVAVKTIEGKAKSYSARGTTWIKENLPVELGAFSKTPIEKSIRVCIQKAVEYVIKNTPSHYFQHK